MPQNEKYYDMFMRLDAECARAYEDKYLLQSIECFLPRLDSTQPSYHVFVHLTELLKRDLALTVYKVLFDPKGEVTLRKFNSESQKLGTKKRVSIKKELSDNVKQMKEPLKDLRNKYWAHLDFATGISVLTQTLMQAAEEMAALLEQIADSEIDDRITPFHFTAELRQLIVNHLGVLQMLDPILKQTPSDK